MSHQACSLNRPENFRGESLSSGEVIDILISEGYVHIIPVVSASRNGIRISLNPEGTATSKVIYSKGEINHIKAKLKKLGHSTVPVSVPTAQRGEIMEGPSHNGGGIPIVDAATGKQVIEAEGGEAIINKEATKEHCETLSEINQSAGGGIAFDCTNAGKSTDDKAEQGTVTPNSHEQLSNGEAQPEIIEAKHGVEVATVEYLDFGIGGGKDGDAAFNRKIESLIDEKGTDPDKYSSDEKELLTHYTGWGGLDVEGTGKGKEALTEFYTPDAIIRKMWALAYKYGFTNGGSVLEPACGIGAFLKYVPSDSQATGVELSKYSYTIASILFPQYNIQNQYFEEFFIKNRDSIKSRLGDLPKFDLVIGNPPYGDVGGIYMGMGEKQYTKAGNWVEYFITRGLDLVKPGGLLIYIIGTEVANGGIPWLQQGPSKSKEAISAKADLLDAYRLPNGVFDRTDVVSDIIVLKKK